MDTRLRKLNRTKRAYLLKDFKGISIIYTLSVELDIIGLFWMIVLKGSMDTAVWSYVHFKVVNGFL